MEFIKIGTAVVENLANNDHVVMNIYIGASGYKGMKTVVGKAGRFSCAYGGPLMIWSREQVQQQSRPQLRHANKWR